MTKLPFLQILEFISHFLCTAQPEVFAESFIWGGMEEGGGLFHSSQAASMCESISSHCMASGCEARRGQIYPEPGPAPVVFTLQYIVMLQSWERASGPSGDQWETCILIYIFLCAIAWTTAWISWTMYVTSHHSKPVDDCVRVKGCSYQLITVGYFGNWRVVWSVRSVSLKCSCFVHIIISVYCHWGVKTSENNHVWEAAVRELANFFLKDKRVEMINRLSKLSVTNFIVDNSPINQSLQLLNGGIVWLVTVAH